LASSNAPLRPAQSFSGEKEPPFSSALGFPLFRQIGFAEVLPSLFRSLVVVGTPRFFLSFKERRALRHVAAFPFPQFPPPVGPRKPQSLPSHPLRPLSESSTCVMRLSHAAYFLFPHINASPLTTASYVPCFRNEWIPGWSRTLDAFLSGITSLVWSS